MNEILITKKSADYELLDSGDLHKLERFGDFVLSRPDPQALWRKNLPESEWLAADATFVQTAGRGKWQNKKPFPENWKVVLEGVTFLLKPSVFKHVGVFPEQQDNWAWLKNKISYSADIAVLNLFASTGGATLACAKAGASVCHVDSSQFAVDCAVVNRDASGLSDAPIRFIVDDVKKFIEREIRRGQKYDIIILDPPVYGKGTKKEIWNLENDLAPLLSRLPQLLSSHPLAVLLSGYASGYSDVTYKQMLEDVFDGKGNKGQKGSDSTKGNFGIGTTNTAKFSSGQLAIEQSDSARLLPAGIFARCEF